MSFLEYLAQKNVIADKEIDTLREESRKKDRDVAQVLIERGMNEEEVMNLRASYLNIPFRKVDSGSVPPDILEYIPEESARHYTMVPIGVADGVLEVGIVDPDNIEARDALQFISSKRNIPFKVFLISQDDFDGVANLYKGLTGEVNKALSELETELGASVAKAAAKKHEKKNSAQEKLAKTITEEAPITKIVAVILQHAVEGKASDVHIEPTEDEVKVRFRVDGVLHTSLTLPSSVLNSIVVRIKVLSGLRLDERRKPQDGSFSATIEDRKIDFRVSTLPTYHGEKVVMRILDPSKGIKKLEETGLRPEEADMIREAIKRPFGLILLTGPTGSGKTTTLYAMLHELDREKNNVISLEDPVEFVIPGVNQSQVRPEIGYTFANGLRSILRQDPDIILVGEIRDKETARLAIQAALTGHLVLSTLHTNNAIGVVPRLVDMGIDPYLIAPTLILAVAQRLVQVICPSSKKPIPVEGAIKTMIEKQYEKIPEEFRANLPHPTEVYEAEPSDICPSGTRGRVGVFELIKIDKEIERVILENPVEGEIFKVARKKGMLTMKDGALLKAIDGVIPFREVNRFE